jgi:ABC-type glycerol-3-phosphate transport system substrate-binding protein
VSRAEKFVEAWYADYLDSPAQGAVIFGSVEAQVPEGIEWDPVAETYRDYMAPYMKIWLDWLWPPEVTTAFQEQIQMTVGQQTTPEEAVAAIQKVLDDLFEDGYNYDAALQE